MTGALPAALLFGLFVLMPGCWAEPDPPGKDLFETACAKCHSHKVPLSRPRTREGWERTVGVMVRMGADLSPAEKQLVVDYLTKVSGTEK